jgi:enterochelin esterase family protein
MHECDGIWSITTDPLQSGSYSYCFLVDGIAELDPVNPDSVFNYARLCSTLRVPGSPWERADVPHGTLWHHVYTSSLVVGLPGGQSEYFVYTPPFYEINGSMRYPVLYLLHGLSQGPADWTSMGHAHFLLDNLIAQGSVQPMIMVMPLGYGDLAVANREPSEKEFAPLLSKSNCLFARILLEEVIPQIELAYRAVPSRACRAVAGISMGGAQSLNFGLHHNDVFAWSAGFSAAVPFVQRSQTQSGNRRSVHFFISCGNIDWLIDLNRNLATDLKQQGHSVKFKETDGGHIWPVWQRNLFDFAQLLFWNFVTKSATRRWQERCSISLPWWGKHRQEAGSSTSVLREASFGEI